MFEFKRTASLMVSAMLAISIFGCSSAENTTPQPSDDTTQQNPASALVDQKCTMCHTRERIDSASYDAATWTSTIDRMKKSGLVITDEDAATIVEYLSGAK